MLITLLAEAIVILRYSAVSTAASAKRSRRSEVDITRLSGYLMLRLPAKRARQGIFAGALTSWIPGPVQGQGDAAAVLLVPLTTLSAQRRSTPFKLSVSDTSATTGPASRASCGLLSVLVAEAMMFTALWH